MTLALVLLSACVVVCLVLEGFFSGSETAIISADRAQLRAAARRGDGRARLAERLLDQAETLLSTTLVGTNLAVVTGTSLATLVVAELTRAWGIPISEGAATILVMSPLILVVGEIVPKSIARGNAHRLTLRLAGPLRLTQRLMKPVVVASSWLTETALVLLGSKPTGESPYVSREELKALADIGEQHGVLDDHERRMIRSVLELRDRPVATVMVPLVDIASLELGASVADLEARAAQTGFARFPVHEGRVDNIVGIVGLADVLRAGEIADPGAAPIAPCVRRGIPYVPESKSVADLLRELRYSHAPMAIVVDEHGGVVGLATTQDLVEEIIGRIRDERLDGPRALAPADGAVFECAGRTDVDELAERTGLRIEHEGFETAAGLVIRRAGRIPQAGETVDLGSHRVEILEATPRRVTRLRFTRK